MQASCCCWSRLIDAFFVTPVRIFVWLTFLGTAYQLVLQQFIEEWRMLRLQRELKDHVILCGYGHSGSIAASELLLRGRESDRIAVIVEICRGQRRLGCWTDPTLRIEAGDRVIAIDANDGR